MTAQIEREPRQGVEPVERWTWRDYAAMSLCYALIAAIAWALICGDLVPVVCLLLATALLLILTHPDQPCSSEGLTVTNTNQPSAATWPIYAGPAPMAPEREDDVPGLSDPDEQQLEDAAAAARGGAA